MFAKDVAIDEGCRNPSYRAERRREIDNAAKGKEGNEETSSPRHESDCIAYSYFTRIVDCAFDILESVFSPVLIGNFTFHL